MSLMDGQDQNRDRTSGHSELSPDEAVALRAPEAAPAAGSTVNPTTSQPPTPPDSTPAPTPVPEADHAPSAPEPTASPYPATDMPDDLPEADSDEDFRHPDELPGVSWTASEFIAHHKSAQWYVILTGFTLVGAALAYLITKDWVAVGVIALSAVLFGVSASHPPRQLQYSIDGRGVHVGQKSYHYGDFRSFSVIDEGQFSSINFMPLKRFSPPLSIYYDPEHEDQIVELLAQYLPMGDHGRTAVEGLMHRIRF